MLKVSLPFPPERQAEGDRVAEVLDVEELVAIVAAPDHREVVPGVRPVVEEREDPETLRPDERLRTDYRDDEPFARYSRQIISAWILACP